MPTLNIEGRRVKVDDSFMSLSPADQQKQVEEIASQIGVKPQASTSSQVGPKDATEIESNPQWAERGKTLYKAANGKDFTGSDQEAAKWLGDYVYDFNHRLINAGSNENGGRGTLDIGYNLQNFSPEAKQAFIDSQHDYEKMGYSWKGAGKAAERILTDPFTYATLGVGKLASKLFQKGATETVEELAKQGLKQGVTKGLTYGAAEGGVYGGGLDAANQYGMINAGGQESYDPVRGATATGLGAATGGVLGAGVGAITGGLAGRKPIVQAARQLVDNPEDAKLGAEMTQRLASLQDSMSRASPDAVLSTREANANLSDITKELKNSLDNLNLPKDQKKLLNQKLGDAVGLDDFKVDSLRTTPEGNAVADQIVAIQKQRALTKNIPNDGMVPKVGRLVLDKVLPVPGMITDPIKHALFPMRISAEKRIAEAIAPKNLEIAKNILELGGPSQATQSRELLVKQANSAKELVEAHKALLKATSSKLDDEAIARNDVPGGGAFKYAHFKTGLKPQELTSGIDQLVADGTIPVQIAKLFKEEPLKLKQGNVLNKILDRLNKMADDGILPRDPKWTPNSGEQVMTQGMANAAYSPAMAQANANQSRVTESIGRVASASVSEADKQAINTAIATIGKTNNRQEALQVQLDLMKNLSDPKTQEIANREIMPLIAQIRHEKPKGK